jgi:hypothetical protein
MSFQIKHHGIVYSVNKSYSPEKIIEHIQKQSSNNVVSGGLFTQCNGPISNTTTGMSLAVLVPVEYVEERKYSEEQIVNYINILNKVPGFDITYPGVFNIINNSLISGLNDAYNNIKFSGNYYLFVISNVPEGYSSVFKLMQFSLIRAMYAQSYNGYLEKVLELYEIYPKEDIVTLLQFATFCYKSKSSYCCGSYMPFYGSYDSSIHQYCVANTEKLKIVFSNKGYQNAMSYSFMHIGSIRYLMAYFMEQFKISEENFKIIAKKLSLSSGVQAFNTFSMKKASEIHPDIKQCLNKHDIEGWKQIIYKFQKESIEYLLKL